MHLFLVLMFYCSGSSLRGTHLDSKCAVCQKVVRRDGGGEKLTYKLPKKHGIWRGSVQLCQSCMFLSSRSKPHNPIYMYTLALFLLYVLPTRVSLIRGRC